MSGGVWTGPAVDKESNTASFVVCHPSPDFYSAERPGDNRYSVSIVAVYLDLAADKWHHQYVANEVWNLNAASPVILTDALGNDGKMRKTRKMVFHGGKTGHV